MQCSQVSSVSIAHVPKRLMRPSVLVSFKCPSALQMSKLQSATSASVPKFPSASSAQVPQLSSSTLVSKYLSDSSSQVSLKFHSSA